MPKNYHTAQLPDGKIAKRTSLNRVYTHCVASLPCPAYAMRQAEDEKLDRHGHHASNFAHFRAFIDGTSHFLERKKWQTKEEWLSHNEHQVERAKKGLNGCETVEDYIAMKHREAVERVQSGIDAGDYDKWSVEGWNGRLELARQLQASTLSPRYREVRIIEAQMVTK
jgi:hypothetical protein